MLAHAVAAADQKKEKQKFVEALKKCCCTIGLMIIHNEMESTFVMGNEACNEYGD